MISTDIVIRIKIGKFDQQVISAHDVKYESGKIVEESMIPATFL